MISKIILNFDCGAIKKCYRKNPIAFFETFLLDWNYLVGKKPKCKSHENNCCQTFAGNPENDTNDKCDQ